MQRPFVQTTHGPIRGQLRGGIALFRGIHYGDRCDGERRFLPPQPAESWQQVRDCSGNGPIAVQFGGSISGSEGLGPHFSGGQPEHFGVADERQSENCLVLNVLTRALPDGSAPAPGRRPVLVYIHGGGFTTGSGTLVLGGDRLVQEEDLVLVGINHRLNAFGFLYLDELDARYTGSGMAGMLDLVLALEWVRDNIAAFGGDPANVTVLGESGGGMKISTLLAMPQAAGLFRRAVVESGSAPVGSLLPQQATQTARVFLQRLGVSPDHLEALVHIPTAQLLAATQPGDGYGDGLPFGPVGDGLHLAPNPSHAYRAPAQSAAVPLMVGASAEEMGVFTPPQLLRSLTWENLPQALTQASLLAEDGALHFTAQNVPTLIRAFRQAMVRAPHRGDERANDPARVYLQIVSMASFLGGGAFYQATAKARQGGAPVYHYAVNYNSPLPGLPELPCAWHTADLPLQLRIVLHPQSEALSRRMAAAVAAFARTGDPSTPGLAWPAFDEHQRLTMVFDDDCRVESDPWQPQRAALEAAGQRFFLG